MDRLCVELSTCHVSDTGSEDWNGLMAGSIPTSADRVFRLWRQLNGSDCVGEALLLLAERRGIISLDDIENMRDELYRSHLDERTRHVLDSSLVRVVRAIGSESIVYQSKRAEFISLHPYVVKERHYGVILEGYPLLGAGLALTIERGVPIVESDGYHYNLSCPKNEPMTRCYNSWNYQQYSVIPMQGFNYRVDACYKQYYCTYLISVTGLLLLFNHFTGSGVVLDPSLEDEEAKLSIMLAQTNLGDDDCVQPVLGPAKCLGRFQGRGRPIQLSGSWILWKLEASSEIVFSISDFCGRIKAVFRMDNEEPAKVAVGDDCLILVYDYGIGPIDGRVDILRYFFNFMPEWDIDLNDESSMALVVSPNGLLKSVPVLSTHCAGATITCTLEPYTLSLLRDDGSIIRYEWS